MVDVTGVNVGDLLVFEDEFIFKSYDPPRMLHTNNTANSAIWLFIGYDRNGDPTFIGSEIMGVIIIMSGFPPFRIVSRFQDAKS